MNSPLIDFQEGQWWVKELDAVSSLPGATPDLKRAVAVVHHMLRSASERDNSDNDLREENKKLRHLLFMAHGSAEHYLYGDDGERTCNTCGIDFNTDSADEISRKIYEYNMRELARIHPEWLKLGDATVRDAQ
jgi:hypothetical protein